MLHVCSQLTSSSFEVSELYWLTTLCSIIFMALFWVYQYDRSENAPSVAMLNDNAPSSSI